MQDIRWRSLGDRKIRKMSRKKLALDSKHESLKSNFNFKNSLTFDKVYKLFSFSFYACICVYISLYHMGGHRGQERVWDPLMLVSPDVDGRKPTQALWKKSQCS